MKVYVSPSEFKRHFDFVRGRELQVAPFIVKFEEFGGCELYFNDGFQTIYTKFTFNEDAVIYVSNFPNIINAQSRPEVR